MKRFAVYGVDTVTALKEYDTFEEAHAFAIKGLRKWSKTVKNTETHKVIFKAWKDATGKIVEKDYRA